jgi:predicted TIM-barrel fold metal-dependent hydrolase
MAGGFMGSGNDHGAISARMAVAFEITAGSCDCHVRVIGDPARFPFAEKRMYTPPAASIEELLRLQRDLKLERVVVVQPSIYAADNSCTVDPVRRLGERARGVVVVERATPRSALAEMHAAGIRGVLFDRAF